MRTRLLRLALAAVIALGVTASTAFADGTETLGPPSIAISPGTGVLAAGVGTELAQPGSFTFAVPATVKQTLLYWTGHYSQMLGGGGDDSIYVRNASFVPTVSTFGETAAGAVFGCPGADRKFGNFFTLPADGIVTKLTSQLKGKADGTGLSSTFRAMIYDNSGPGGAPGALKAVSGDVTIAESAAAATVDFALAQPRFLPAGTYFLALQSGGTSGKGCVSQTKPSADPADVNYFNVDSFANGPSDPYGPASTESAAYTISATYETPGVAVTGQLIGGPKLFFTSGVDFRFATYRADITSLGLVGTGANSLTVSGLAFKGRDGFGNDGAGVLVVYDEATPTTMQGIRDGQDLAFDPSIFLPTPTEVTLAERQTEPQTFTFAASPHARVAKIALLASSVEGDASGHGPYRPNWLRVTFGLAGGTGDTTVGNPFSSASGAEFDATNLSVTVPAGATQMTLQALSLPDAGDLAARPASFNWLAGSLALDNPPCFLGDFVWIDGNRNGIQDDGPTSGVNGVLVELLDGTGTVVATFVTTNSPSTGAAGWYRFEVECGKTYRVRVASSNFATGGPLEGKTPTTMDAGPDNVDSDGDSNSTSPPVSVPSGENITIDFGYVMPQRGGEGCTPGYWKNHDGTKKQGNAWLATPYRPNHLLSSVFSPAGLGSLGTKTLRQALDFGGGTSLVAKKQILLRHAVAALLNSSHPDVSYGLTTAQVISQTNAALLSNDGATILALANELDKLNNAGCPLGNA